MIKEYKNFKYVVIIIVVIVFLVGCIRGAKPEPEEQSDYEELKLDETIDTIMAGLPYAVKRVEEWRNTMTLNYINIGFEGKEEIEKRKGEISFFFYEEGVTEKLDADAFVSIDMNKNCIVRFSSTYGTPKELIGSSVALNTDDWTIDIAEVFDIVEEKLGINYLNQYGEPKIVIRCSDTWWDFAVYENSTASYEEFVIEINPISGDIVGGYDNR